VKQIHLILALLTLFFFFSCAPGYKAFIPQYQAQINQNKTVDPDYTLVSNWAAHPLKKDPSDSIPKPLRKEPRDSSVDVFFIHPTTLTNKSTQGKVWNASLDDYELNAKTDYSSILYQASVFNTSCRIYAPRYRQAHLFAFYTADKTTALQAFELAYADVKKAFEQYLKTENRGRPIIIAAHSQGAVHAQRLLKEYFENKPLQQQLVCAYLIGMVLPKDYFSTLQPCNDSAATGCFVGWRTYKTGYLPEFVIKENGSSYVTNPLSWKTDDQAVSRSANKGALLFNFNKILPHTNGATIEKGVIWIEKPRFPFSFLSSQKNYHVGDMNLFYMNIRENIATRIRSYFQ
jgi:hypothetical protein